MPQPSKPRRPLQNDGDPVAAPSAPPADTGAARRGRSAEAGDKAMLHFEPEQVLAGIVFHVIDEGLARGVCADSVAQAVGRLRSRAQRPAIRRSAWLAMTHHDRLEWLLAESRTTPLVREDDVVILNSREN